MVLVIGTGMLLAPHLTGLAAPLAVIDLSGAAKQALGMRDIAPVRIEVLR
jgi:hypothetical protein